MKTTINLGKADQTGPAFVLSIQQSYYVGQQEQNFWDAITISDLADMRKMEGKWGFKKCQKFLEGTPCKTMENALLQIRTSFSSQTLKLRRRADPSTCFIKA